MCWINVPSANPSVKQASAHLGFNFSDKHKHAETVLGWVVGLFDFLLEYLVSCKHNKQMFLFKEDSVCINSI